ncbi:MAG: hypothetical protein A2W23_05150 [Planctomycetes bacterium RBG_16_43_13]|nr:MAG: hypothetical protein A2W23_05150 [Planctomycetes bacterium RBG_16_43_13]
MFCSKCGSQVADDSAFCSKCGVKLSTGGQPIQPSAPISQLTTPSPTSQEQELWRGGPSGWSLGTLWLLDIGWIIALTVIHFKLKEMSLWLFVVLGGVPLLFVFMKYAVLRLTIRYRLTTQRLFREEGFLSRRMSEIELFRVDDVAVEQGISQRLFGTGNVTVRSTDSAEPLLVIKDISNPFAVKEQVREAVRNCRSKAVFIEGLGGR